MASIRDAITPLAPPYITTRPFLASATFVAAEPTVTRITSTPSYSHAAAYLSMRIMTIGGLTLLLIGLCCLAAVLLRFSRYEHHAVHVVDHEKALVLDQSTINKTFPIRIYPSAQRLFLDEDEMVIAAATNTPGNALSPTVEKPHSHQVPPPPPVHQHHSFMGLGRVGKLWARDSSSSSRGPSRCNSPLQSQPNQMPALATSMITLQNHSASHSPELSQSSKLLASTTLNTNQESTQEHSTTVVVTTDGTLEDLCSICLGEYETNDRIRILPCNHEYHAECVDIWLTHKSTHCPLCKHDLLNDVESTVPAMFPSPSL